MNRDSKGRPGAGRFAKGAAPQSRVDLTASDLSLPGLSRESLRAVMESAAQLQKLVPDAVLVGGSAVSLWADHRSSTDHDHVVADLTIRFDVVLGALEETEGWVTNRVAPGVLILGELGGIESGVRQLRRARPLEICEITLDSGELLRVPTFDETLRIKGFLIVRRNQARDYLDVAALSHRCGEKHAASVLGHIDEYYRDQRDESELGVATQLVRQLSDPRPKDSRSTTQLGRYRDLDVRWREWSSVVDECRSVAEKMSVG